MLLEEIRGESGRAGGSRGNEPHAGPRKGPVYRQEAKMASGQVSLGEWMKSDTTERKG